MGMRAFRKRLCYGCVVSMLALVVLEAPASAQVDTATILGTVTDSSGAVLPGATVTITHEGQGFTLSTVTREDGTYVFTPIRTGTYTVQVELPSFRTVQRRGISVAIQQQAQVDVALEPGGVAEELVVTADAPLLETGTGTVGQTLPSQVIENLP
ncbi:MAG: carboxypeptidase-like regulatory domain-containing protein [Vicinamibacteraceae bacterium]